MFSSQRTHTKIGFQSFLVIPEGGAKFKASNVYLEFKSNQNLKTVVYCLWIKYSNHEIQTVTHPKL